MKVSVINFSTSQKTPVNSQSSFAKLDNEQHFVQKKDEYNPSFKSHRANKKLFNVLGASKDELEKMGGILADQCDYVLKEICMDRYLKVSDIFKIFNPKKMDHNKAFKTLKPYCEKHKKYNSKIYEQIENLTKKGNNITASEKIELKKAIKEKNRLEILKSQADDYFTYVEEQQKTPVADLGEAFDNLYQ